MKFDMKPLLAELGKEVVIESVTTTVSDEGYITPSKTSATGKAILIPIDSETLSMFPGGVEVGGSHLLVTAATLHVNDIVTFDETEWKVVDAIFFEDLVGLNCYTVRRHAERR